MITYFLNVGYGESIVIQNEDRVVIIDGGSGKADTQIGEITLIDFLKSKKIQYVDLVICTHIHDDHIGGLVEVFQFYDVKKFICNMYSEVSVEKILNQIKVHKEKRTELQLIENSLLYYRKIIYKIKNNGTIVEEKYLGDVEEIYGNTITFYGLTRKQGNVNRKVFEHICNMADIEGFIEYDQKLNGTSLAMHISGIDMFLTGDLVHGYERFSIPQVKTLKLTHHGQVDGMNQDLLDKTQPNSFVICTNKYKKYNSACTEILNRCEKYFKDKGKTPQIYITGELDDGGNGVMISDDTYTVFYLEEEIAE